MRANLAATQHLRWRSSSVQIVVSPALRAAACARRARRPGRTEWAPLAAIAAIGAAFRFAGTASGLPRSELFDEPNVFRAAVAIARGGGLDPRFHEYGTVFLDLLAIAFAPFLRVAGWTVGAPSGPMGPHTAFLWWLGRSVSALAGSLTVVLCCFAARRMWGRAAGRAHAPIIEVRRYPG